MTSPLAPLGRYGVWLRRSAITSPVAAEVEKLGYGTLWVGGSPEADLAEVRTALEATTELVVATGIVNIWKSDAAETARTFRRLDAEHPGRVLLGIGSGHREATPERTRPLAAMSAYLDVLDAEGVPAGKRVISALGPRMLQLAADRTAGSHPYLSMPAHTAWARTVLGDDAILAPEVMIVDETAAENARRVGRATLASYLRMSNYTRTMTTWGFTDDDVADGGSDRLVDALTVWGTPDTLAAALRAHTDAGASHVCAQPLPGDADPIAALTRLADSLGLR